MRCTRAGTALSAAFLVALSWGWGCGGSDTGGNNSNTGDATNSGNQAPVVTLSVPADGAFVAAGEPLTFTGSVSDDADAPDRLTILWTTNRTPAPLSQAPANSLGGTTIEVTGLVPGEHVITLGATDSGGKVGTATVTITVNAAPGAPEVVISPVDPTTADALTATVTVDAVDPNRAATALTYRYRWFKDGVYANATAATLPAAVTAKGEVWQVRVVAHDGVVDGAEGVASVTIGNSAPSCAAATILPSAANTTKDIVCSCSGWSDPDGDAAHDRCAFLDGATPLPTDGACTLPASATDKGMDVHCVLTPSDGEGDGAPVTSGSVPVLNAPPTAPTVALTPATADAATTLACTLATPGTDPDGDSLTYTVAWFVDGFENAGVTSSSLVASALSDAAGHAAKRGSRVTCQLRASDGTASSAPAVSAELVLDNAAPTLNNALVTVVGGAHLDENAVLGCTVADVVDADGDPVTLSYVWVVAGAEVPGAVGPNLSGDHFAKGQSVSCAAVGDDGQGGVSAPTVAKNTVTIGNTPPSLLGAALDKATLSIYDQLTCVPEGWVDADGDPLEVSYTWVKLDGGALTPIAGQNGPKITPNMLAVGDQLACQVTPKNGADVGPMVQSPPATLVPPAPTAPIVTVNAPEGAAGAVRCDFVEPAKHFAGAVTYTFYWRINGGAENLGNATISGLTGCDLAACRAVASDATTTLSSAPATQLLPVGDDCATGDACKAATCKAGGGCDFVLATDLPCDDGNGCTTGDHCELGFCIAAGFAGDGAPCQDGQYCTATDACDGAGTCRGGASPCQVAADGCLVGTCDELEDKCIVEPKPATTPCSDGSGCTAGDACGSSGVCLPGTAVSCAASTNACAVAQCKSLSASDHSCVLAPKPAGVACSTGDFCTVDEACDGQGGCGGGAERDCDAEIGDDCNSAYCDPDLGQCRKVPAPAGTLCDDANTCTVTDACVNGTCQGSGNACVDEPLGVAGATAAPSLASIGYGRYAAAWWNGSTHPVRVRYSDALGSRENEEVATGSTARVGPWRTGIAARSNGTVAVPYFNGSVFAQAGGFQDWTWFSVFPELRGLALDVDGNPAADVVQTTAGFSVRLAVAGWARLDQVQVQAVTLLDGSFGLLTAQWVSSAGSVQSMTPRQSNASIAYYPPTGLMTVGSQVMLVPSDVGGDRWDSCPSSDGTDTFLVAWADGAAHKIYARRFTATGAPAAGSSNAWPILTGTNAISAVSVVGFGDSKVGVFWSVANEDSSGLGVYGALFDEGGNALGAPFRVNAGTTGDQRLGGVARFANNDFVVVFDDQNGDSSGWGVKARLYTAGGAPKGSVIDINSTTAGSQYLPSVVVLDTDEWVVAFIDGNEKVWTRRFMADGKPSMGRIERKLNATTAGGQKSVAAARMGGKVLTVYETPLPGKDQGEIVARLMTPSGPTLGPEVQVNQVDAGVQVKPAVAAGASHYAIAWESSGQDGAAEGIYARLFDANGDPSGDELQVNQTTPGYQRNPAIAVGASDNAFVAWCGANTTSGSTADIYLRVIGPTGAPVTSELIINTTLAGLQDKPAVAIGPDGNAVVAWQSNGQDGSGYGVYLRRLDPTGNGLSAEALVNSTTDLDQRAPTLAIAATGNRMVVCWESLGQDATGSLGVYCQVMDYATLGKIGGELRVHALTAGEQRNPKVAWLATGEAVVAWDSEGVDSSGFAAQYRRITAAGALTGPRTVANRTWAGSQERPVVVPLTGAGLLVLWDSADQDGSDKGVYYRLMSAY